MNDYRGTLIVKEPNRLIDMTCSITAITSFAANLTIHLHIILTNLSHASAGWTFFRHKWIVVILRRKN